jgi:hypothetical protein
MVYDSARRQIVIYGGIGAEKAHLSDMWAWNGRAWKPLFDSGTTQPPALDGAKLLDAGDRLLLLGGARRGGLIHQIVWSWDGRRWSKLHLDRLGWPRRSPSIGFDPKRRTAVRFGGTGLKDELYADTWFWKVR